MLLYCKVFALTVYLSLKTLPSAEPLFLNFYAGPAPAPAPAAPAPAAPAPAAPVDSDLDPDLDPDPNSEDVMILDWFPDEPVCIIYIFCFLYIH